VFPRWTLSLKIAGDNVLKVALHTTTQLTLYERRHSNSCGMNERDYLSKKQVSGRVTTWLHCTDAISVQTVSQYSSITVACVILMMDPSATLAIKGFHHLVRLQTSNKCWHAIYVVIDRRWSLAAFNYKLYRLVNGQRSRHGPTTTKKHVGPHFRVATGPIRMNPMQINQSRGNLY
jgi:hypothetical protein